jgi:perosamine synthetase
VTTRFLPYGRQSLDDEDIERVVEVLRSDWLTTGPTVQAFEEAMAKVTGAAHAIAVQNGTAALHAAINALGIKPGDEVIVPTITFAASANCALYEGATPVFCEVDPDTLSIDANDVERRISAKTRAVIAVDYAGQPCDYAELAALTDAHDIALVADAAHSLGATYRTRAVGSLAALTTFSFHPVKHITTGEGGMVTTDDPELAARIRRFRNHGHVSSRAGARSRRTTIDALARIRTSFRSCAKPIVNTPIICMSLGSLTPMSDVAPSNT